MSERSESNASNFSAESFYALLDSPDSREEHRRDFNDIEWLLQQPKADPQYKIGDVMRFHVGGYGVINQVIKNEGWPPMYATQTPIGFEGHANRKCAWHLEGDFAERIAKSPLHSLENIQHERRD